LIKSTAGTVVLTGANTSYTGATTINASGGTLTAGAVNALGGTSSVTINTGGTLLLADGTTTNHINDSATMVLAGGTFNTAGLSEHGSVGMGPLSLTSSSVINLASGASIINFANSSGAWTGTLNIWNWSGNIDIGNGTDQVILGTNNTALMLAQLAQVTFYSDSGINSLGTAKFAPDNDGEIVPFTTVVPEPSTWVAGALVFASLLITQRRRFARLLQRA
jgi:autotransporter-associated beta strand protein